MRLHQSYCSDLLDKCPAVVRLRMLNPKPPTQAMLNGTIVHALSLGSKDKVAPIPFDSWNTKDARALRDAALESGRIPLLEGKLESYAAAAANVCKVVEDTFGVSLQEWVTESNFKWESEEGIKCESTLDAWRANGPGVVVLDLKVTADCSPSSFERAIVDRHLHTQAAAYKECVGSESGPGALSKYFILAQQLDGLHCLYEVSGMMMRLGEMNWAAAKGVWSRCIRSGEWPGYSVQTPYPTQWAIQAAKERMT